jgi:hypothetical protein
MRRKNCKFGDSKRGYFHHQTFPMLSLYTKNTTPKRGRDGCGCGSRNLSPSDSSALFYPISEYNFMFWGKNVLNVYSFSIIVCIFVGK